MTGDPRWRLAGLVAFAAGVTMLHRPPPVAAAAIFAVGVALLARVSIRRLGLLLLGVLPFLVVLPLTAENGLTSAALIVGRVVAIGSVGLAAVPLPQTFAAAHSLGLPRTLTAVALLAFRYVELLGMEVHRLRVGLRTRGFRPRTDAHTYRTLGRVAGALLVRGGERAERVAAAMRCRGFDGTPRPFPPFRTRPADVLLFLAAIGGTTALVAWDRLS